MICLLNHECAVHPPPQVRDVQGVNTLAFDHHGGRIQGKTCLSALDESEDSDAHKEEAGQDQPDLGLHEAEDADQRANDSRNGPEGLEREGPTRQSGPESEDPGPLLCCIV